MKLLKIMQESDKRKAWKTNTQFLPKKVVWPYWKSGNSGRSLTWKGKGTACKYASGVPFANVEQHPDVVTLGSPINRNRKIKFMDIRASPDTRHYFFPNFHQHHQQKKFFNLFLYFLFSGDNFQLDLHWRYYLSQKLWKDF